VRKNYALHALLPLGNSGLRRCRLLTGGRTIVAFSSAGGLAVLNNPSSLAGGAVAKRRAPQLRQPGARASSVILHH